MLDLKQAKKEYSGTPFLLQFWPLEYIIARKTSELLKAISHSSIVVPGII
jgi:hypothetical protein